MIEIPHKGHTHIWCWRSVGESNRGKMHVDFNIFFFAKTTREKQIKPFQTQGQNRRVMEEETAARRGSIAHPKVENVDIGLRFRR